MRVVLHGDNLEDQMKNNGFKSCGNCDHRDIKSEEDKPCKVMDNLWIEWDKEPCPKWKDIILRIR